jgi:hypothetical protein
MTDFLLAIAATLDAEPVCSCGHDDHRPAFGCVEAWLDTDGETWLACPCNRDPEDDR